MKKTFDIFLYVGAVLLAMVMITVLFSLKWKQNAKKAQMEIETYQEMSEVPDSQNYTVDAALNDNFNEDLNENSKEDSNEDSNEEVADNTVVSKGIIIDEDDPIYYLGGDFADIQKRYADSEQLLGDYNHYFKDYYLSVYYDEITGEIMCIENDGVGKKPIKLAGLEIGITKEDFLRILGESDISYTEVEGEDKIKYSWNAGEKVKYKAEIEFEEGKIIDITCRVR